MIVIDSSAILSIILGEPEAENCLRAVENADDIYMSAVTFSEVLIVARSRGVEALTRELLDGWGVFVLDVTPAVAYRVTQVYANWGKGNHRAGLNFCDCFAYEAATSRQCPLLFVGDDFSRTDVISALPPT